MKEVFLVILILSSAAFGLNNNHNVNEGASTSSGERSRFEINSAARRLVQLLIAEDKDGHGLHYIVHNRFHELEAFQTEFLSVLDLVQYGNPFVTNEQMRLERLYQFSVDINEVFQEYILRFCDSEHYHDSLSYQYDLQSNRLLITENINYTTNSCSCGNERELTILNEPFAIPHNIDLHRFLLNDANDLEFSEYYIIPLSLISKFFRVWLTDIPSDLAYSGFDTCLVTILGRLRLSLKKLFIAQTQKYVYNTEAARRMQRFNFDIYEELGYNYIPDLILRSHGWLSGNIFLGPRDRGPLNPQYNRNGADSLDALDEDAETIVGRSRYLNIRRLNNLLLTYVRRTYHNPFFRLVQGFRAFILLITTLGNHDIALMNSDDWEEREPTDEELDRVTTEQARRITRTQKYWGIKRPRRRNPRSATLFNKFLRIDYAKKSWKQFVSELMSFSIESIRKEESLDWSCDFMCMYNDYLFRNPNLTTIRSNSVSFNEFLYMKISESMSWRECNKNEEQSSNIYWCLAWRRIMKKLEDQSSSLTSEDRIDDPNWKDFSHDSKIFLSWLSSKLSTKKRNDKNLYLPVFSHYPYHPKNADSAVDNGLCLLYSVSTLLTTFKTCLETFKNH